MLFVLENAHAGQTLQTAPEPHVLPVPEVKLVSPAALQADRGEAVVFDLSLSREYRRGHVPGAIWISRPRLAEALKAVPASRSVVLVSPDGVLARYAAAELDRPGVTVLDGGALAWRAAGHPEGRRRSSRTSPPTPGCGRMTAPTRRRAACVATWHGKSRCLHWSNRTEIAGSASARTPC